MPTINNILNNLPNRALPEECFETLLTGKKLTLKKIISTGQTSPNDMWYDQSQSEWLIVLQGDAIINFEKKSQQITLNPGDYLLINPHEKHRIHYTNIEIPTVWLALYFEA